LNGGRFGGRFDRLNGRDTTGWTGVSTGSTSGCGRLNDWRFDRLNDRRFDRLNGRFRRAGRRFDRLNGRVRQAQRPGVGLAAQVAQALAKRMAFQSSRLQQPAEFFERRIFKRQSNRYLRELRVSKKKGSHNRRILPGKYSPRPAPAASKRHAVVSRQSAANRFLQVRTDLTHCVLTSQRSEKKNTYLCTTFNETCSRLSVFRSEC
jgi:hypothetical protein